MFCYEQMHLNFAKGAMTTNLSQKTLKNNPDVVFKKQNFMLNPQLLK
jgi:hypothetical protein